MQLVNIYHPMCLDGIVDWMNGLVTVQLAAYTCNMVDSRNFELVELLLTLQW